jgi:surface polysaccharide O-acyltransferase-like enzyme
MTARFIGCRPQLETELRSPIVMLVTVDDHLSTSSPVSAPAAKPDLSKRDLTLDFVRVVCVLLVVLVHLLEVGVGRPVSGGLAVTRPLDHEPWFAGATWAGQVMPLFFVVGGFASLTAWRSATRKGKTAAGYIQGRVIRLALPALPLFIFYVIVIGAATLLGVDAAFLKGITNGAGSPLWFLAAYVLVQAFVPLMSRLHERAPKLTLGVLFAAAVLVDVARFDIGITEIGLINLVFVWLFVQQVGFWYADGWFARRAWWQLVLVALVCYLALVPLTTIAPYSPDMLTDLNPPTVPLMLLAVAQACVLRLLKRPLSALMRTRGAQGLVYVAGTRLMTIYLWHLPLIIALSGLCIVIPGFLPTPLTGAWWWTRIPFYLVVLGCLYGLSFLVGRFERPRSFATTPPLGVVWVSVVLTFIPAFAVLEWFLDLKLAILGAVCIAVAVMLLGWRPWPRAGQNQARAARALVAP